MSQQETQQKTNIVESILTPTVQGYIKTVHKRYNGLGVELDLVKLQKRVVAKPLATKEHTADNKRIKEIKEEIEALPETPENEHALMELMKEARQVNQRITAFNEMVDEATKVQRQKITDLNDTIKSFDGVIRANGYNAEILRIVNS